MGEPFGFSASRTPTDARAAACCATPHGACRRRPSCRSARAARSRRSRIRDVEDVGAEIILGNTYHLHLRPGDDLIARAGGLHAFIGWPHPILTDSGGYQVFSLAAMRKVTEEGVEFRSHLDGALVRADARKRDRHPGPARLRHRDGARRVVGSSDANGRIGTGQTPRAGRDGAVGAMGAAGADAAAAAPRRAGVAPAVQRHQPGPGAVRHHPGRRSIRRCGPRASQATVEIGFEAYAIGGLSVGEPVDVMYEVVGHTAPQLPADRPRYLMGTGHARRPGRVRRPRRRPVRLRAADPQRPERPAPDPRTASSSSRTPSMPRTAGRRIPTAAATPAGTSAAPISAIYSWPGEMTAATLLTIHNLYFYLDTMRRIREAIGFGSFEKLRQEFHQTFSRRPQQH